MFGPVVYRDTEMGDKSLALLCTEIQRWAMHVWLVVYRDTEMGDKRLALLCTEIQRWAIKVWPVVYRDTEMGDACLVSCVQRYRDGR